MLFSFKMNPNNLTSLRETFGPIRWTTETKSSSQNLQIKLQKVNVQQIRINIIYNTFIIILLFLLCSQNGNVLLEFIVRIQS